MAVRNTAYDEDILSTLPKGSDITRDGAGIFLDVACKHGHTDRVHFAKRFPSDAIRRMLANKGWQFNGNRATCPMHADNKVEGSNVTQISEAMKAAQKAASEPTKPAPSLSAKEARREAIGWLADSFDIDKGRYKDDMSDAKIAELTGLSAKAVADLRADFGYDIKTDPEIEAMRAELVAISTAIIQFKDEAAQAIKVLAEREQALSERLTKWERTQ